MKPISNIINELIQIKGKIERLSHIKKYDTTYRTLSDLASELQLLVPESKHIRLSAEILEKYKIRSNDKSKNQIIEEFKEQMTYDLNNVINSLKRNENINND